MSTEANVEALEAALLTRAERLAEEYLSRARQSRERIIEETDERLRLREEREILAAKAMAERVYRRRVQASELKLQGKLDRLRWELVQAVVQDLRHQLRAFAAERPRYLPVLQRLLGAGANAIEQEELVAELNQQDLECLEGTWEAFAAEAVPGKHIRLSPEPLSCSGGVQVVSKDRRIRVDNTFEGRLDRLAEELHQAIIERLFAQAVPVERVFHHG
ncbi:H+transporting two-sector ATPase E subunit [Nitrosococcus halophilus Nc 4]|uniref:V-type proton ATPase subunit E n=1 Tax=Nitrosococcus halophilus (strain Nc4) TaxID=472759 RepID=D5BXK4_NITHN|nr:V-type ATP synthase subunit E family protein [Nitrosococcus halophilus]ADE13962.1 H+transporting two-sector ATPase E subunit [Nitrosococcus halophilus Nc 4]